MQDELVQERHLFIYGNEIRGVMYKDGKVHWFDSPIPYDEFIR